MRVLEELDFTTMPIEMKLDLLVDDELPESQRAALIRSLSDSQWRELSIRFLERQVEHKGVKQLISAASVFPEDAVPPTLPFSRVGRFLTDLATPRRIAASLFIGLFSAALTAYVLYPGDPGGSVAVGQEFVPVSLPENLVGPSASAMEVQVPVLATTHEVTSDMFLPTDAGEGSTKRSIMIVPQGENRAVAVPLLHRAGVSIQ